MNITLFFQKFRNMNRISASTDEITPEIKNQILHQRGNINNLYPSDISEIEKNNIDFVKHFTMTSYERLVSFSRGIEYLEEHNIEGDIVECGVWRGGSMMIAALRLIQLGNTSRKLFMFDTYEGMSEPINVDISMHGNQAIDLMNSQSKNDPGSIWCFSPIDEVKSNLYSTKYSKANLHFVKGKVENTLPNKDIGKIAILRLDTDWYESTLHELNNLFDSVVPGGLIIIDDYGHWSGSKKAVDEFLKKRQLKVFLNRIDYSGRLIVKPL